VQKYHRYQTLTGHLFGATVMICNKEHYQSWPADLQAAVDEAGRAATRYQLELAAAEDAEMLAKFKAGEADLLVCSDVAARGLDIDNITHVINYNLPDDIENYTHRSGRTARAGKKGESLVLINTREGGKIRAIEKQMRTTFTQGSVPNAEEICEIQLMKLINKVIKTDVREKEIQKFMPTVMAEFEDLSKEEVIKHFVSAEFNRFIEYYERAGDLNAQNSKDDRGSDDRSNRRERKSDGIESGKTRFFVSIGSRDGLNPGGLLRHICDATGLNSSNIGATDELLAPGTVTIAEKFDTGWKLIVNGTSIELLQSPIGLPYFEVQEIGSISLIHDGPGHRALISLQLISLLVVLVLSLPAGRRRRELSTENRA
jgi:ATP-dependent RNA helicase DeaD